MNYSDCLWVNGECHEPDAALVPALDRGLLYGDGVFETMRLYRGRTFRLDAHLARLHRGLRHLQITDVPPLHLFERLVHQAAAATGGADCTMRLTVTRGAGGAPSDLRAAPQATILIRVTPHAPEPPERYLRGVAAIIAATRRNEQSPLSQHKTLNYLDNLLARAEARTQGAYEAILLNTAGEVAEASAANLFIVTEGLLITPPLGSGALPGVTRAGVLAQAAQEGIVVREERVSPERLITAQEAFFTNSLIEIMPLTVVAGRPIGSGAPGPITLRLVAAYRAEVAEETRAAQ